MSKELVVFDKELLESAAKACGFKVQRYVACNQLFLRCLRECAEEIFLWNPLINIEDCAEMEAQLEIDVVWEDSFVVTKHDGHIQFELYTDHHTKQSARMLAVTRVAAEIGRRMSK